MLRLYNDNDSNSMSAGNMLTPELQPTGQKVLIINTRSDLSDLVDHSAANAAAQMSGTSFFLEMLKNNEDLQKDGVPAYDVVQLDELKLSADQNHEDWVALARMIEKHYHDYCGFVVQDGMDSMCTTATALSFMLKNLGKPVVFTGSVVPGNRVHTDLKRNIILALSFAGSPELCEVCILFDAKLFRANRATCVSRSALQPFDSPHYPPLATMEGGTRSLHRSLLRPQPHGELWVMPVMDTPILTLQLGPGLEQAALLKMIESTRARALLLLCHGSGNGPLRGGYMSTVLAHARRRGLVVVIGTQNRYGSVHLHKYAAGSQLATGGAVGAADMTNEAVVAKLKYLFGLGLSPEAVKEYLLYDLRGEITITQPKL